MKEGSIIYETKTCIIPIIKNYVVFSGYGDVNNQGYYGDLIIKIDKQNFDNYYIIDNYHLLLIKDITLYQYIYGFQFKQKHFDTVIDMGELRLLNNKLRYQIRNKGLPYDYDSEIRGELILQFNIKYTDNNENKTILENNFNKIIS